jgi:hypothetical protein
VGARVAKKKEKKKRKKNSQIQTESALPTKQINTQLSKISNVKTRKNPYQ